MKIIREHHKLLKIDGENKRYTLAMTLDEIKTGEINIDEFEINHIELFKLLEFAQKGAMGNRPLNRNIHGDINLANRLIRSGSIINYLKSLEEQLHERN